MANEYPPDLEVTIPGHLVESVEKYVATDWAKVDPSKFGALNAVAYIGEQLATLVVNARKRIADEHAAELQRKAREAFAPNTQRQQIAKIASSLMDRPCPPGFHCVHEPKCKGAI
jgi:hypothetical protein